MCRVEEMSDKLEWGAMIDLISDVFDRSGNITDGAEMFFEPYQFLFRLTQRLKHYDTKEPFNQISIETKLVNHDSARFYRIKNYDYNTFLWCRKKGFTDYISNDIIEVPYDGLTASERLHFDKQCKDGGWDTKK